MAGLPEITLAGTLVADPELRFTPTGVAVANFTVAANDRRYDRDTGTWEDKGATFLRCSIWRDAAEHVTESLRRGQRVLLTGALRQRDWHTPEGDKRTSFEVDVTEIGPSLKWATTQIHKPTTTATTATEASGASRWDPTTGGTAGGCDDKPPF